MSIWRRIFSRRLPQESSVPVLDGQSERGVIFVHSDKTRDILLRELSSYPSEGTGLHRGTVSSYLGDQLCQASSLIHTSLQSRQLIQIVGSPQVLSGLKNGSLSILRSGGQMTGTVVSTTTHRIAGQLRFAPAHTAGITGPLAVWQILNAVAGVRHLERIDAKLEALQRGIERLEIRSAARVYGQIFGAIETLNGLSEQYGITGTFSPDMTMKLSHKRLADAL